MGIRDLNFLIIITLYHLNSKNFIQIYIENFTR